VRGRRQLGGTAGPARRLVGPRALVLGRRAPTLCKAVAAQPQEAPVVVVEDQLGGPQVMGAAGKRTSFPLAAVVGQVRETHRDTERLGVLVGQVTETHRDTERLGVLVC
jgi:hypothetical protein